MAPRLSAETIGFIEASVGSSEPVRVTTGSAFSFNF